MYAFLIAAIIVCVVIAKWQSRLTTMQRQIDNLAAQLEALRKDTKTAEMPSTQAAAPALTTPKPTPPPKPPQPAAAKVSATSVIKQPQVPAPPGLWEQFETLLRGNLLLWMGATVLALGGIFLARCAIEAGILPPEVRLTFSGIFGVGLVIGAEYLARHKERFKIHTPALCAALASGGVITCYAITLTAFLYYQFLPANLAFVVLAAIAITTTWLSLRFGPVLAIIGLLGAYLVPALVSTGSHNIGGLLLYISVVSASAIWVAESVARRWLWWLSMAGHMLWFITAVLLSSRGDVWYLLAYSMVTLYLFVLVHILGWNLADKVSKVFTLRELLMPRKSHVGVVLPLLLVLLHLNHYSDNTALVSATVLFALVMCYLPLRHSAFDSWPFLILGFACVSMTLFPKPSVYSDPLFVFQSGFLYVQLFAIAMIVYAFFMAMRVTGRPAYLVLLVITPMCLYGISYALSSDDAATYLYPIWSGELALLAVFSSIMTIRVTAPLHKITFTILANTCLTLILTIYLNASVLTLAIAIQVACMSYLSQQYKLLLPDWLYKVALSVIAVRLSVSPWWSHYANESLFGVHWTLIVYPFVLGVIFVATRYNPSESIRGWMQGIMLHIAALFVTTETSYQLVGHYPDFGNISFKEAALLAQNWLILACVYIWRRKGAEHFARLYDVYSKLLLAGGLLLHIRLSLIESPFIAQVDTGSHAVINWMLVLWVVPAYTLVLLNFLNRFNNKVRISLYVIAAFMTANYVNGLIRSLFHDGNLLWYTPLPQGELYTYSIVWLMVATGIIIAGTRLHARVALMCGFGLLAAVIMKAFLVDMANLEGLLRALSFIGLGLCLVGIGWLFQKLSDKPASETSTEPLQHS